MKLLLDTHLLIWLAQDSDALSASARELIGDPGNDLQFSVASIWEIAIKRAVARGFDVDPRRMRYAMLDNDFEEIGVTSEHAITAAGLPPLHKDPFDRLLIAQSMSTGALLVSSDHQVARYSGPIRHV